MQDDASDSEDPKKAETIKEELKNLIKQIPQKKKTCSVSRLIGSCSQKVTYLREKLDLGCYRKVQNI